VALEDVQIVSLDGSCGQPPSWFLDGSPLYDGVVELIFTGPAYPD
jgi:hypothetical protein